MSDRTTRHRLNHGRGTNNALWRIVITRMGTDQRARDYVTRRTTQCLSKRKIIRCVKTYVAREIYTVRTTPASPTQTA